MVANKLNARGRIGVVAAAASIMVGITAMVGAGDAQAAPAGKPNAGVPLSSVVYGTGCTYPVTMAVNSSGWVAFYEYKPGLPPRFVGRDLPDGALATITWVPRYIGEKYLYGMQNGVKSPMTKVSVRQGYGSNGLCFGI
ncbi:hypothetical protein QSJ18_08975 [Gordonia sp. ABSL1-1]|uniref:hypothetical protein n=1 Tax=Gordonia sp. ABSL1-1 TaxID=3053923 RepID=UPI002572D8A4|nr:hypothetical protein [Gordonia sp. ABSL1-1]MDL9936870.1 hypothetical protein [Gordonia sp. ABSL1-1]